MKLVRFSNPVYPINVVDRLLNDLFSSEFAFDGYGNREVSFEPATNIYEDEKAVEIEIAVPGYEKEQVKISVENNNLVVSGTSEKKEGQENESSGSSHIEFRKQNFEKKFRLSEKLDSEKVDAVIINGILKITVAKKEEVVPQKREIEVA